MLVESHPLLQESRLSTTNVLGQMDFMDFMDDMDIEMKANCRPALRKLVLGSDCK